MPCNHSLFTLFSFIAFKPDICPFIVKKIILQKYNTLAIVYSFHWIYCNYNLHTVNYALHEYSIQPFAAICTAVLFLFPLKPMTKLS